MKLLLKFKGGQGSGNFGHAGREGQIGGSSSSDASSAKFYEDALDSVQHFPRKPDEVKVKQAVDIAMQKKSFGTKTHDFIQEQTGLSDGAIQAILKAVKDRYKTEETTRSHADARADTVLRIRDSTGRAVARRSS